MCIRDRSRPGDPDVSGVGVDSVHLGVPRGRAPKVPEKAGRVSLDFIRTRPEVPPRGPQGGTPTFPGSGQVGVDSIDLRVPQGRAPKVLRRSGQQGVNSSSTA